MSWAAETNIKGPKGDKGDPGPTGPPGASGSGAGDVTGPAGAVADRIAVFNGATGKVIKDGGKLISELGGGTASGITFTPAGNIAATNVQAALVELDSEKEPVIASGTTAQYWRGDKSWQTLPAGGGSGAASGITFTPAGNLSATDVQAALVELDTEKVAKAGDTMTGNLIVSKANPSLVMQKTASGQANQLAGYNSANARWSLALGDSTAEGGSNAGSNFALYSYTDAGTSLGTPLTIARADGGVTLTGVLTLPNGTAALPSLTFTGGTTTGLYYSASALNLTVGGTTRLQATGSGNISTVVHKGVDGVVGGPGYSFNSEASSGLYRKAAGSVSVSGANSEVMNWLGSTKTTTAFGPVLLAADPTVALQAATKQYVDTQITTRISVVKTLLITASGTYTPSAGMVYCTVEVVGGGGAGGGVPATAAGQFAVGSGGSGGSYSRSTLTAAQVGPSQTVTVGAGGTGVSAATGNNGVASSFGALVTAPGGLGGAAGTASASSGTNVTQPGAAGTGTIAIRGFAGSGGFSSYPNFAPAGIGGGSGAGKGSGGATGNLAGVGASGGNYGGGGGGASINASIAAQLGGAGGPGAIIITEYCTQ